MHQWWRGYQEDVRWRRKVSNSKDVEVLVRWAPRCLARRYYTRDKILIRLTRKQESMRTASSLRQKPPRRRSYRGSLSQKDCVMNIEEPLHRFNTGRGFTLPYHEAVTKSQWTPRSSFLLWNQAKLTYMTLSLSIANLSSVCARTTTIKNRNNCKSCKWRTSLLLEIVISVIGGSNDLVITANHTLKGTHSFSDSDIKSAFLQNVSGNRRNQLASREPRTEIVVRTPLLCVAGTKAQRRIRVCQKLQF